MQVTWLPAKVDIANQITNRAVVGDNTKTDIATVKDITVTMEETVIANLSSALTQEEGNEYLVTTALINHTPSKFISKTFFIKSKWIIKY